MTIALAIACGLLIGMVLGGLGGGGSVLAVPALVYVLGQSAQEATTASLFVVGLSAVVGTLSHHRDRHVRWRLGLVFAVIGTGFSFLGTMLNGSAPEPVLLGSFAALLVVSAAAMITRALRGLRAARIAAREPVLAGTGATHQGEPEVPPPVVRRWRRRLLVVLSAAVVGFLTGFLGVGGGFVVVPALVILLGLPMPVAAGTSLLVIVLNSAVAFSFRLGDDLVLDWAVVLPFTATAIVASFAGRLLARRVSERGLSLTFAALLVLVAAGIVTELAFRFC